jgi:CubicO group peptidase (beta-lactamase class C family)
LNDASAAQAALASFNIPGAAVIAIQDGEIVYAKAYGYADLEQRTPLTPEHTFPLASVSKHFTAAAVMLLVEEGKLALDVPISRYAAGLPAAWGAMTLRQLLSHTSGLPEEPLDSALGPLDSHNSKDGMARLLALSATPLAYAPGTYSYSNLGYGVAGILVGKASGMELGAFLQQRIFAPLGMASTRMLAPGTRMVAGYKQEGSLLYRADYSDAMLTLLGHSGAGGVETNVLDMVKWDAAQRTERILKKASLEEMWRQQVATGAASGYGLGWNTFVVNGHRLVNHMGSLHQYATTYRRFLDDGFSVVVLTNRDTADLPLFGALHISREVTRILRPELKI